MGTAQNQCIDTGGPQRFQILPHHRLDDHVSPPDAAVLHQRHQQRTGFAEYLHLRVHLPQGGLVGAGADGGLCGDHADPLVFGHRQCPAAGRLHHADDGQVVFRPQRGKRCGGDGTAGDEDGLEVKGPQKAHILPGVLQNGLPGPAAVRHPGGIPEINESFLRQNLPERVDCRQTAQAGVEHPDRPHIHKNSNAPFPVRRRGQGSFFRAVTPGIRMIYYTMGARLPQDRF